MAEVSCFQTYRTQTQALLNAVCPRQVAAVCDVLQQVYAAGGTVWACGNGGSASTASSGRRTASAANRKIAVRPA